MHQGGGGEVFESGRGESPCVDALVALFFFVFFLFFGYQWFYFISCSTIPGFCMCQECLIDMNLRAFNSTLTVKVSRCGVNGSMKIVNMGVLD